MAAPAPELEAANRTTPADLWSAAGSAFESQAFAPPIVPVARRGESALSHSQERLYFLQSGQNGPHYQVHLAWRVTGDLKIDVLEQSLRSIVARHEILRTIFPIRNGRPVAVVLPQQTLAFQVIEVGETDALRAAQDEVRRPFDLSEGPLIRAALFRMDPLLHLLVVTVCQIVFDGWSMRVFSRELRELYSQSVPVRSSLLPPLPIQWADFVAWQKNVIEGPSIKTHREYWRARLATPYAPLRLPVDHPQCVLQTPSGTKLLWSLSSDLLEPLNDLARREGATHFTALLAAIQAWLYRLTGQEDIIVFASTFARTNPETRTLIGPFANVLPLRTGLAGHPTFREVLRRVRDVSLGAFAHTSLPFESMLEMLTATAGSAEPLFQAMLIHQNAPLPVLKTGEATFTPTHEVDSGTAKFDFLWDVAETRDGLTGTFTYRSDLFDAATIQTLLRDFESFVEDVVANSDRPVSQLQPILTDANLAAQATSIEDLELRDFVAPRDRLEEQLAVVWENVFGRAPIGMLDDFFDLGGSSLLAVRLLAETERFTGTRLPMSVLLESPTIEKLAVLLRKDGRRPQFSSLVPIRSAGSKPPIYCISGVGGSVLLFHALARLLPDGQPVYGLEPPPRGGDQPMLASVEDIAAHYIREIREVQPEGPYYLVGFSFGGMVIFEMAQQFYSQGEQVGLLALFDTAQESCARKWTAAERIQERLRIYNQHMHGVLAGPHPLTRLGKLIRRKGLKILYRGFQFFGRPVPRTLAVAGTTEDVQVFARTHYRPCVYAGRVTLFRARIRPGYERFDYELGWGKLAAGGVEVHDVPGDHHSMVTEPNIRVLAKRFALCLERAQTEMTER